MKKGVQAAGLVGMRFNTIGVSDGISMGTDGMSYSLQSRDLIADSIETRHVRPVVRRLHRAPRLRQEHARLRSWRWAGSTGPASWSTAARSAPATPSTGEPIDIVSAFTCYGELMGKMTDDERREVVRHACPGAGACGGMYTANTMASAIEAMGMSLPYSSSIPATDPGKLDECRRAGDAIRNCWRRTSSRATS